MNRVYAAVVLMFVAGYANAAWLNTGGRVLSIAVYPHTDTVLFTLDNPGVAVAGCADLTLFAIDGSIPGDRRKQLVALLMAAQARDQAVAIAYSDSACVAWDGSPGVFRMVTRITAN